MPKGTAVPSNELRKVLQLFKTYDTDGSATMNRTEFQKLLEFLDPSLPAEGILEMFTHADTSTDGQIDYQEFVAWLYDEDAPQNKDLSIPALNAEKAFKTRASKHTSNPKWNEVGIIDIAPGETLVFSLYDSYTFHK